MFYKVILCLTVLNESECDVDLKPKIWNMVSLENLSEAPNVLILYLFNLYSFAIYKS